MILNKLITDPSEVVKKVQQSIDRQHSLLLTYLNQHSFNIYCQNKDYQKVLDSYFQVYQADLGIFLSLKFLLNKSINRIDATAMSTKILNELIQKKIPLVLVGGNFDEEFIKSETEKRGIKLAGYLNGYFKETSTEDIIKQIDIHNSQVIIVAMGVPQQELFSKKLSQRLNSKVIICVGNFLEFYFGTKKRAPVYIQKIGFEWMFRLFAEPRRLWNRYIIGIPHFIYRILKLKFNEKSY